MKHRRGIDLAAPFAPATYEVHDGHQLHTLKGMLSWEVLGARCGKCGHIGWIDHHALLREIDNQYLKHWRDKLACVCGNKEGNDILIGRLPR
jgi:hypothetical protein